MAKILCGKDCRTAINQANYIAESIIIINAAPIQNLYKMIMDTLAKTNKTFIKKQERLEWITSLQTAGPCLQELVGFSIITPSSVAWKQTLHI